MQHPNCYDRSFLNNVLNKFIARVQNPNPWVVPLPLQVTGTAANTGLRFDKTTATQYIHAVDILFYFVDECNFECFECFKSQNYIISSWQMKWKSIFVTWKSFFSLWNLFHFNVFWNHLKITWHQLSLKAQTPLPSRRHPRRSGIEHSSTRSQACVQPQSYDDRTGVCLRRQA